MNIHFLYTKKELDGLKVLKVITNKQKEKFFDKFLDCVYNFDLDKPVEVQFTTYLQSKLDE